MKGKKKEDTGKEKKIKENGLPEELVEKEEIKGVEDTTSDLEVAKKEASENYDKYLRLAAEFDNYKKRTQKERTDLLNYGNEKVLRDILPVVDGLERALGHATNSDDIEAFIEGLKLILGQFLAILEKNGVKAIESVGNNFDPNFHEAMLQVESKDHEHNEIVEEFEKGYLLNGRLLRPAKVSVAKRVN